MAARNRGTAHPRHPALSERIAHRGLVRGMCVSPHIFCKWFVDSHGFLGFPSPVPIRPSIVLNCNRYRDSQYPKQIFPIPLFSGLLFRFQYNLAQNQRFRLSRCRKNTQKTDGCPLPETAVARPYGNVPRPVPPASIYRYLDTATTRPPLSIPHPRLDGNESRNRFRKFDLPPVAMFHGAGRNIASRLQTVGSAFWTAPRIPPRLRGRTNRSIQKGAYPALGSGRTGPGSPTRLVGRRSIRRLAEHPVPNPILPPRLAPRIMSLVRKG